MDEMADERQMRLSYDDAEYERLVSILDQLTNEVGEDETHPLASLMEVIGVQIERYEDDHIPELDWLYTR